MIIENAKQLIIKECIFKNNFAFFGGSIYHFEVNNVQYDNILLRNNTSVREGGGVYIRNSFNF